MKPFVGPRGASSLHEFFGCASQLAGSVIR